MSKRWSDHQPEYTEAEQQKSLISRRIEAFESRSREPGDAATWAIVLGSLMSTLLIVCYSVSDVPIMALVAFGMLAIWIVLMARFAGVNVFSILWGSATTDTKNPPNELYIFQSTIVIAGLSFLAMIVDAFTGWDFTWYGVALFIVTTAFVVLYVRSWLMPASRL